MRYLIVFLILFPFVLHAQNDQSTRRFEGSIVAGMNAGQINGDNAVGYRKLGFIGGLKVDIILKEKVTLGLEMLFSQRGSTETRAGQGVYPFKIGLNYIEVPVYISYKDWLSEDESYYRMRFYSGLSYARLFSHSTDTENYQLIGEYFKENDISWLAGATYYVNKNIGISGRYTRSLTPLFKPNNNTPNASTLTTYQLSLMASYTF